MADISSEKKKLRADRGTQDDLEILKQVICENRALFNKVMDTIRTHRATSKDTLLDNAATKYDKKMNTMKGVAAKK